MRPLQIRLHVTIFWVKIQFIMEKYCYLNGRIVELKDAKISITDLGVLRGYGVFDFLRTYDGTPFLVDKHLDRLENSAKEASLKIPISRLELKKIIYQLIKKNKAKSVGIRIVVTGGESEDGLSCNPEKSTLFVLMQKISSPEKSVYEKGVKLITYNYQRELAAAKTTNYLTKLKLQGLKKKKNAFEILYVTDDQILEGATCNFFVFKGDTLVTPKDNILLGTRRGVVIKLAKKFFKVEERPLKLCELSESLEAFLTSISKDIVPVTQINEQKIGDGKVGKNTKLLMKVFKEFVEQEKRQQSL